MSPWGPKPENPVQGKGLYPPQLAETAARGCAAFRVLAFRVTFGGVALRSAGPPSGRVVTAGPALCRWGRMHGWTCREREDLLHLPG